MTQTELSNRLEATGERIAQPTLSHYEAGRGMPGLDDIARIERILGLPPGQLLIDAGYVRLPEGVEEVIEADPELTVEGKITLLATYRALRNHGRSRRQGG